MLEEWTGAPVDRSLPPPRGAPLPRRRPQGWLYRLGHRQAAHLEHAQLRWYTDPTWAYRITARAIVPAVLNLWARVAVEGLAHVPSSGPVIVAANHRDNLDPYLLFWLLPRPVHVAARPDAFGSPGLCGLWRTLGAFPADAWGMRYAVSLLAAGGVVAMFPQARTSHALGQAQAGTGLVALRSGAPVVPVAITGTDAVHLPGVLTGRASISVRFGRAVTFDRQPGPPRSRLVADEILRQIGALLSDLDAPGHSAAP